ncbi:metallophosphoesterase [Allohahella marinimesophila]|uniref:Metallophosphoesterase family protein n=1 Tax=Allohahella marinimesophila TaxID=1054972 RepID=A0ABP7Q407_9GAMM
MNILHISDTHFGTEIQATIEALLEHLEEFPSQLVIFSGDITQRARVSEFKAAAAFLRRLPDGPVMIVPGNHDIPLYNVLRRFSSPYGRYDEYLADFSLGQDHMPTFDSDRVSITGLDTTDPARHKDGLITEEHIQLTSERLRAAETHKLKIVFAHQPVDAILEMDEKNIMHNAEPAIRQWAADGMDLYLGGHIHFPFMQPLRIRYPDIAHDAWTAQCGTTFSTRIRNKMPNSFNRICVGETRNETKLERWEYDYGMRRFKLEERVEPWL